MEGFTIFDGAVAGVILISSVLAFSRGFVREAMSIVSWIAAGDRGLLVRPGRCAADREIPYLGDFIGSSCELGILAGFTTVFVVALVLISFFTPVFLGDQALAIGRAGCGPWVSSSGWRAAHCFSWLSR
jgi:membrane protein required for colicin V production